MIDAAEQMFRKGSEFSSLIWLNYVLRDKPRPLIFMIHDHGWWKGFPDLWDGEPVQFPHPGTVQGFAHLIEKAQLGSLLGAPIWPERPYRTEVCDEPWQFQDSYGRLLKLELPGMNVHIVSYP